MGRPRKAEYRTRDPQPVNRDPQISETPHQQERQKCRPRRYIQASMPCVCPDCGHNTRQDSGRHIDPVRQIILEYRTCIKCGALLAAERNMTVVERHKLCSRVEAVREYEELNK